MYNMDFTDVIVHRLRVIVQLRDLIENTVVNYIQYVHKFIYIISGLRIEGLSSSCFFLSTSFNATHTKNDKKNILSTNTNLFWLLKIRVKHFLNILKYILYYWGGWW